MLPQNGGARDSKPALPEIAAVSTLPSPHARLMDSWRNESERNEASGIFAEGNVESVHGGARGCSLVGSGNSCVPRGS